MSITLTSKKKLKKTTYFVNSNCLIIESISKKTPNTKLVFKKWHFVTLIIFFVLLTKKIIIYINSKCIISLIDKNFLKEILSNIEIKKIRININIKKIGTSKHMTNDYCLFDLYIFNISINQWAIVHIRKKIYIIDNFKAKMLLSINILNLKRININVDKKKLLIKSYNDLITNIKIKVKNNVNVRRTMRN